MAVLSYSTPEPQCPLYLGYGCVVRHDPARKQDLTSVGCRGVARLVPVERNRISVVRRVGSYDLLERRGVLALGQINRVAQNLAERPDTPLKLGKKLLASFKQSDPFDFLMYLQRQ